MRLSYFLEHACEVVTAICALSGQNICSSALDLVHASSLQLFEESVQGSRLTTEDGAQGKIAPHKTAFVVPIEHLLQRGSAGPGACGGHLWINSFRLDRSAKHLANDRRDILTVEPALSA